MARPTSIQDDEDRIPYTITKEDVKQGFKKWKERTSTSPSGRHLGHYKSWIQDNTLLDLLTLLIQIPIKFGFAPAQWCQSLNVMLEKDPGNPMIHRLVRSRFQLGVETILGKTDAEIWRRAQSTWQRAAWKSQISNGY
jgi:hypothetical protein